MTMHTPPAPPRPARLILDDATWDTIAEQYRAGATAPEIAARYRISRSSLHRHMKKRGVLKRAGSLIAVAHAEAADAETAARRAQRWSADDVFQLTLEPGHEPAHLCQLATTAAGNAMINGDPGMARMYAELGLLFLRLTPAPETMRERVIAFCFDREATDYLYSADYDGVTEQALKRQYWKRRNAELAEEAARAEALEAAEARVRELEERLGETPSPPRAGEGGGEAAG